MLVSISRHVITSNVTQEVSPRRVSQNGVRMPNLWTSFSGSNEFKCELDAISLWAWQDGAVVAAGTAEKFQRCIPFGALELG